MAGFFDSFFGTAASSGTPATPGMLNYIDPTALSSEARGDAGTVPLFTTQPTDPWDPMTVLAGAARADASDVAWWRFDLTGESDQLGTTITEDRATLLMMFSIYLRMTMDAGLGAALCFTAEGGAPGSEARGGAGIARRLSDGFRAPVRIQATSTLSNGTFKAFSNDGVARWTGVPMNQGASTQLITNVGCSAFDFATIANCLAAEVPIPENNNLADNNINVWDSGASQTKWTALFMLWRNDTLAGTATAEVAEGRIYMAPSTGAGA